MTHNYSKDLGEHKPCYDVDFPQGHMGKHHTPTKSHTLHAAHPHKHTGGTPGERHDGKPEPIIKSKG